MKKLISLFLFLSIFQGCSTFEYTKCYQVDLSKIPELQPIIEITGNVVITPCFKIYLSWEDIKQGNFANLVRIWFADGKWNAELIKQTETDAGTKVVNPVRVDIKNP